MPQTSVEGIPSTRRHGTPGRRPSSTKKASPPGESFHSGIPEIVDLFIADRRAAGRAPATIRYYRETLGRFVRFAGAEPDIGAAAHAWATDRYANARSEGRRPAPPRRPPPPPGPPPAPGPPAGPQPPTKLPGPGRGGAARIASRAPSSLR